jgi:soluble lytic murein transglycosylase
MRSRLFHFLSCFLLSAAAVQSAQAVDLSTQRQYYDEAKRALAKGDTGPYFRYSQALADYPLEPYLAYDELTARLKTASNAEIEKFLAEHGDLPQANWMKLRWLRWLADRGDWATFVKYYDPKLNFTELDCLNAQYQISHNLKSEGYANANKLWLTGKSQPAACDALFGMWAADGQLTEQKRWERTKLAAQARNYPLANSLVNGLSTLAPRGRLLVDVAQNPELLNQPSRFTPADEPMSDVVSLGLRRLARQDPDRAMSLLDGYASSMHFSRDEKVAIAREIGLTLARRFDSRALDVMTKYDPELRDNTVSEWRLRLSAAPGPLGRRLSADPTPAPGSRHHQPLALLAGTQPGAGAAAEPRTADPLQRSRAANVTSTASSPPTARNSPYSLNNKPLVLSQALINKVRSTPGVRRALEFHARGQIVDGRREWYHVSRHFSRDEMVAQAKLAYDLKWYFPAIRTISQAQYWDDLDIRFPMAHREHPRA